MFDESTCRTEEFFPWDYTVKLTIDEFLCMNKLACETTLMIILYFTSLHHYFYLIVLHVCPVPYLKCLEAQENAICTSVPKYSFYRHLSDEH